jgi:hypothetical protein
MLFINTRVLHLMTRFIGMTMWLTLTGWSVYDKLIRPVIRLSSGQFDFHNY